tara:strand:+ start:1295 stop:2329 length:1035 start_codon:yes stop_codon:yes gene_type:complete
MLKLGVIGFGRMGITHYSILNSHPDVKIKAVADKSTLILNLLKKYVSEVNTYDDYEKLLLNEKLDAIIICTPPTLHYAIAIEAAKHNAHVFMEKPCTLNKNEAEKLSKIFVEKKLVNQVGYVNRFNGIFTEVKRLLDKNIIGDLIRFKSEMYSATILKSDSGNSWRDSKKNGGGATIDMAAHAIDLVNYLIGMPDKIIGSNLVSIFSRNVEDAVSSTLLYNNGITGTLNVNWSDESYRKPTNKIEIFGSKGKIMADQHGIKIFCKFKSESENFRRGWNTIYITDIFTPVPFYVRGNEFTSQLYHFIDSIIDQNISTKCTFQDAAQTLYVIEEIFHDYKLNGRLK